MSVLQPYASTKHLDLNRYPMCAANLKDKPGSILRSISPVIIDTRGTFPFLLFRLTHRPSGLVVFCIRGSASFPNDEAIDRLYSAILGARFLVDVQGGGTIQFSHNCVQIFGGSDVYGRADHHLVGKLIKFCFSRHKVQYEPAVPASQLSLANPKQAKKSAQKANRAST